MEVTCAPAGTNSYQQAHQTLDIIRNSNESSLVQPALRRCLSLSIIYSTLGDVSPSEAQRLLRCTVSRSHDPLDRLAPHLVGVSAALAVPTSY